MRVAITGGSGFIGTQLVSHLRAAGHVPVVLTRGSGGARGVAGAPAVGPGVPAGAEARAVDYANVASVAKALEGCDAVVNLAGANVFEKRWSASYRTEIRGSRVLVTRSLVDAMATMTKRPQVLLSGSAVGHYGPREPGETVDETTARAFDFAPRDFLASVCYDWERAAQPAERLGVRVVYLRTGVVLGRGGGAYEELAKVTRMFVGGPLAGGKQDVSWIHLDDVCGLILFALERPEVRGAFNLTAPNPVTNKELAKALGRVLHRPSFMPTPGIALRILKGKVASMLTTGQRVLPKKALDLGYVFRFPTIDAALADLVARDRAAGAA
jgi:uncharacterized protein (TIGR01777 family)